MVWIFYMLLGHALVHVSKLNQYPKIPWPNLGS